MLIYKCKDKQINPKGAVQLHESGYSRTTLMSGVRWEENNNNATSTYGRNKGDK